MTQQSLKDTQAAGNQPPQDASQAQAADFDAHPVLTEQDQQQQREKMEAELRLQAQKLDPAALHPKHEVPGAIPEGMAGDDRVRGESLPLERLLDFRGRPLLAADGGEIGVIREVLSDESDTKPEWIAVETSGLLGARHALAPVFGSYAIGETMSVPYTRDQVLASPARTAGLTPEARSALREHYALPAAAMS